MERIKAKKKELDEITENFKNEFSEDLTDVAARIERGLLIGVVAAGLAYISYKFLKRALNPETENAENKPSSLGSKLGEVPKIIGETAVVFLLNLAKEKLLEYLQQRKSNASDDTSEDY